MIATILATLNFICGFLLLVAPMITYVIGFILALNASGQVPKDIQEIGFKIMITSILMQVLAILIIL